MESVKTKNIPADILKGLFVSMLRIRLFEEKIVELYPEQEMKCPVHLCIGQEAIAAGACFALKKEDYIVSNHRGHGHCLAKGASMRSLMAEFYGKATGCSKGKGGSMHLIDLENGIHGTSAIVGGGIPIAAGVALASKMKKDNRVTMLFFGDGAFDEGVFYESFNFACLKKLPIVFMCENNFYATNSHKDARHAAPGIFKAAQAFGAEGFLIDGNDAGEVFETASKAIEKARKNGGPTLIEAVTYRWKGHVGPEADYLKGCRPEKELIEWIEKCPVKRLKENLLDSRILTKEDLDKTISAIADEINDAVKFAKESPYPAVDELYKDLYYEAL